MTKDFTKLLSTFFYIGYFPVCPGTIASAAGGLFYLVLCKHLFLYIILMLAVIYAGFKVSGEMEEQIDQKDPGCIVIDEVAGVMITFFLLPLNWAVVFTAFFLFRAFDMFKIYPANKMEEKGGSFGIMMDDIVAGLYANMIMQIAIRWAGII